MVLDQQYPSDRGIGEAGEMAPLLSRDNRIRHTTLQLWIRHPHHRATR